MKRLCALLFSMALALAFSGFLYGQDQDAGYDFMYKAPPELQAKTWLNAKKPLSLKKLKGKQVVILEFMTTTCPHCVKVVPRMKEIHEKLAKEDGVLIAITHQKADVVQKYAKENNIQYPIAVDPDLKTATGYGVGGVPYVYIIGKNGLVCWQNWGQALDDDELDIALAGARATAK